jgi:hypothetical protein
MAAILVKLERTSELLNDWLEDLLDSLVEDDEGFADSATFDFNASYGDDGTWDLWDFVHDVYDVEMPGSITVRIL